jgi:hypothetical protein
MNWLNANINHLTVPIGVMLGLAAAILGYISQQKRKAGASRPYVSEGVKNIMIVVLLVCAVLLGFAIAKTSSTSPLNVRTFCYARSLWPKPVNQL